MNRTVIQDAPLRKELVAHGPTDACPDLPVEVDAFLDGDYIGSFPNVACAREALDRQAYQRLMRMPTTPGVCKEGYPPCSS